MISVNPKRIKEPELVTRGLLLQKAGHLDEAREIYHQVLDKHPHHAVAKFLLALCYEAANEQVHAFHLMDEVVQTKPNFAEAWYNRGVILHWLGRIEDAKVSYERSLKLAPNFASAWTNLGNVKLALGDEPGALKCYQRCTDLKPDNAEGEHNRSFVYLMRGEWARGWVDYEKRWALPGQRCPIPHGVPWWQGEDLAGQRIALAHEQGYGDTLMTLRYVPLLQAMGAEVVLCVPPALTSLIRASLPGVEVRTDGSWPEVDVALPFMSLMGRFQTEPATVPSPGGYLVAPPGRAIPEPTGFPAAFQWRGSVDHKNDRNRSSRLSDWAPLLGTPGVTWYCVQRDATEEERTLLQKYGIHFPDTAGDWGHTASVLSQVNAMNGVLISVDTAIVHLAGGLGLPTCALLSALPDFRWMLHRSDTVWYEQTHLYRQPVIGDWQTPMTEIAARLRAVIEYANKEAA
jgi:tetratricopeptide (TPR) repeat protein